MKRIGRLFDQVAGPALERHGRQQAMLLAHWPEIAGDIAAFCRPERLQRPRGRGGDGLTLRLKVMPGRALEVQHMAPQLMERINAFFGHRLVGRLTFVQAPLTPGDASGRGVQRGRTQAQADPARLERLQAQAARVTDPALAESLKRLAAGVAARASARNGTGGDRTPGAGG